VYTSVFRDQQDGLIRQSERCAGTTPGMLNRRKYYIPVGHEQLLQLRPRNALPLADTIYLKSSCALRWLVLWRSCS
jgi:hypothetical protein